MDWFEAHDNNRLDSDLISIGSLTAFFLPLLRSAVYKFIGSISYFLQFMNWVLDIGRRTSDIDKKHFSENKNLVLI